MGALALAPFVSACSLDDRDRDAERTLGADRLLDHPAAQSPIDTVVVVMLENRSFDHYLGWLSADPALHGCGPQRLRALVPRRARASTCATTDAHGKEVRTQYLLDAPRRERSVSRLRPQDARRTAGAPAGSNATTDSRRQERATTASRSATTTAPTSPGTTRSPVASPSPTTRSRRCWPGRSRTASTCTRRRRSGMKTNPPQLDAGIYAGETIWDRLEAAGVPRALLLRRPPVPRAVGRPRLRPDLADRRLLRRCREGNAAERRHGRPRVPRAGSAPTTTRTATSAWRSAICNSVFGAFARSPQWNRAPVRPHLRRVGRLLRPRRAAGRRRRPREHDRRRQLRADRVPRADDARVTVRAARVRRQPTLRPHVDPAVHRVALPRRAGRRTGRAERSLVPHRTRPPRQQHRRVAGHDTPIPTLDIDLDAPIAEPSDGVRSTRASVGARRAEPGRRPADGELPREGERTLPARAGATVAVTASIRR